MTEKTVKESFKQLIVDTGLEMIRTGMTVGTWGNISVRDPDTDLVYISPSGMDYRRIKSHHVVVLTTDLEVVDGTTEPSIERHMHCEAYKARSDVNAVIHTHPLYSSVFGVVRMDLPAVSEDFAQIVGEEVRVCRSYELPGTAELAREAVATLGNDNAVILPSHGALAVGESIELALKVSHVLEKNATIYLFARMLGQPTLFKHEDVVAMQDFARNFYGKKNENA